MSAMELLIRLGLPILTFGLGILVALLVKRSDVRREIIKQHATTAHDLTAQWYQQLQGLRMQSVRMESNDFANMVDDYRTSRHLLPKLLLSRNILSCYSEAAPLVRRLNDFLEMVTESSSPAPCRSELPSREYCVGPGAYLARWNRERTDDGLAELDNKLQAVGHEAGALITQFSFMRRSR